MYIALDIETTGLDIVNHQVLEIGAVFNDFTKPVRDCDTFEVVVDPGEIVGTAYALVMNQRLLKKIANGEGVPLDQALTFFALWMQSHGVSNNDQANLVGKNIGGFDIPFLNKDLAWPGDLVSYRSLDVGSMWATTNGIPGQSVLCQDVADEYGLVGEAHTAVYDAQVSLALAREKWFREKRIDWLED